MYELMLEKNLFGLNVISKQINRQFYQGGGKWIIRYKSLKKKTP